MRIAGIVNNSIVDGEGIRMTIFLQGCPHHCEGCHNPQTWDYDKGYDISVAEVMSLYKENPLLQGITFSGGEPIQKRNISELIEISKEVHILSGDIWLYSGYYLKDIPEWANVLLSNVDTLVDGPFILSKKDMTLKFRGSSNQSIIKIT